MRSDVVFKTVNTNVSLTDDDLFSSFQALPLSTSLYRSDITVIVDWAKSTGLLTYLLTYFRVSLLQAIDGVISFGFVPAAPRQFRSSETQATNDGPSMYLLGHFHSLRHVQGNISTAVFDTGQSSISIPLFAASSLNL